MFRASRFRDSLRGRFMPAVDEATMPASLLSRMTPDDEPAVVALLRLLAPISGGSPTQVSFLPGHLL